MVLADWLRTDGHRHRALTPPSDAVRALRALARGRDDLAATRVQRANPLRSQREGFRLGVAAIRADVASPIALSFFERYPAPHSAGRLGVRRLVSCLARRRYCGWCRPEGLPARPSARRAKRPRGDV